jgi:cytochrome b
MRAAIPTDAFARSDQDRYIMTTIVQPLAMNADVILRWSSAGHDAARLENDADFENGTRSIVKTVLSRTVRPGDNRLRALIDAVFASSPRIAANVSSTGVLQSP